MSAYEMIVLFIKNNSLINSYGSESADLGVKYN